MSFLLEYVLGANPLKFTSSGERQFERSPFFPGKMAHLVGSFGIIGCCLAEKLAQDTDPGVPGKAQAVMEKSRADLAAG